MASLQAGWILLVALSLHTAFAAPPHSLASYERPAALVRREANAYSNIPELSPINEVLNNEAIQLVEADSEDPSNKRDKRFFLIHKTGAKALLLNFIFGKIDGAIDAKTRWISQLDQQNAIKNEKYFGITTPPPAYSAGRPAALPSGSVGSGRAYGPPRTPRPSTTTLAPVEFSTSSPVSLVIPPMLYGSSFGLVTNISMTIGDVLFNTAGRAQEFSTSLSSNIRRNFGFGLLPNPPEKKRSSGSAASSAAAAASSSSSPSSSSSSSKLLSSSSSSSASSSSELNTV